MDFVRFKEMLHKTILLAFGFLFGLSSILLFNYLSQYANDITEQSKSIRFSGLENVNLELPDIPSQNQWDEFLSEKDTYKEKILDDVEKFGTLAQRYHGNIQNSGYYISINEIDVTSDEEPDYIISFDGGGTFGIIKYEIVSNGRIIARITSPSVGRSGGMYVDHSGNGFSMKWYEDDDMFPDGYCCPIGYVITRFVYEDDIFKPVYEQEIWTKRLSIILLNKHFY